MSDLVELFALACCAALYPVLVVVVVELLRFSHPKRLLGFFLAGGLLASLSIGLVAVFALDTAGVNSSKRTVHGGANIVAGLLALVVAAVLRKPARSEARTAARETPKPSFTQRTLSKGSAKLVFVLGIVLNLPGLWYIVGLKDIALGEYTAAEMVLLVVAFNLVMFALVEVPLVAFAVAPEPTSVRVNRFNEWLLAHGRQVGARVALVAGVALVIRGIVALA